jgi:glycosyltransferase involved in cell wall biosynthesis
MSTQETCPLVSVAIPTYNRADLLALTLKSLKNQTYQNLEIIVSDNGSPDPRVQEVAEQAVAADPRIRYYRQPTNKGAYFNFNFVRAQATADFMMWSSDDHEFNPDHIEKLMALHLKKHYSVVGSYCDCLDPEGNVEPFKKVPEMIGKLPAPLALLVFMGLHNWIYAKANLFYGIYRTEYIRNIEINMECAEIGSDHLILYEVMLKAPFGYIPEKTWVRHFNYYLNPSTCSKDLTWETIPYYLMNTLLPEKSHNLKVVDTYTQLIDQLIKTNTNGLYGLSLSLVNQFNRLRMATMYL